jgi:acid phosphatase
VNAIVLPGLRIFAAAATLALLPACGAASNAPAAKDKSLLWTMRSAEYRASTAGIFASAAAALPGLIADTTWTAALEQRETAFANKPAAVVVDVDETLLNNARYQWELAQERAFYSDDSWDAWVARREAVALTGAAGYVQRAHTLNVTVFYVTNRACRPRADSPGDRCPQATDTLHNLAQTGFPSPAPEQLLLKGMQPDWGSEKSTRRSHIAMRYRIVQLVGDDLGDFVGGARGAGEREREQVVREHRDTWGRGWFMLPNPTYGSWERALTP